MANYVARNGLEFEVTVRNKNDPRFEFLQEWHVHHQYYLTKKEHIKKVSGEDKLQWRLCSFVYLLFITSLKAIQSAAFQLAPAKS